MPNERQTLVRLSDAVVAAGAGGGGGGGGTEADTRDSIGMTLTDVFVTNGTSSKAKYGQVTIFLSKPQVCKACGVLSQNKKTHIPIFRQKIQPERSKNTSSRERQQNVEKRSNEEVVEARHWIHTLFECLNVEASQVRDTRHLYFVETFILNSIPKLFHTFGQGHKHDWNKLESRYQHAKDIDHMTSKLFISMTEENRRKEACDKFSMLIREMEEAQSLSGKWNISQVPQLLKHLWLTLQKNPSTCKSFEVNEYLWKMRQKNEFVNEKKPSKKSNSDLNDRSHRNKYMSGMCKFAFMLSSSSSSRSELTHNFPQSGGGEGQEDELNQSEASLDFAEHLILSIMGQVLALDDSKNLPYQIATAFFNRDYCLMFDAACRKVWKDNKLPSAQSMVTRLKICNTILNRHSGQTSTS